MAYFVHDLTDPAVAKRVAMLRVGGAEVIVVGFRRADAEIREVAGVPAIDLGRTYDARFVQRIGAVARQAVRSGRLRRLIGEADVFIARNLEMLLLAQAVQRGSSRKPGMVYECLDVHRLLVSEGRVGQTLRALERALLRRAQLVIVSSDAFLRFYFRPRQGLGRHLQVPVLVVENKVFPAPEFPVPPAVRPLGPPWRIGWFGAIRCRRSLDILTSLARRRPDLVEVIIRGRPSPAEFPDLAGEIAGLPNVTFAGPYAAADLPMIYGEAHFTWAIDYFEAGANSDWLLPNRIYEGGLQGVVPLALADVQTGAWLAGHDIGVRMRDAAAELEGVLDAMTPEAYAALAERSRLAPKSLFMADAGDCERLTQAVAQAA